MWICKQFYWINCIKLKVFFVKEWGEKEKGLKNGQIRHSHEQDFGGPHLDDDYDVGGLDDPIRDEEAFSHAKRKKEKEGNVNNAYNMEDMKKKQEKNEKSVK